ncbi:hypothetical protein BU16DRAFT_480549 [Lophium mytilinum]|uniref:Ferric oxidoreductase domain-containing protein n=1 Tax=Lophium mytilinum TaxID=390894 RepID=A0A6A6R5C8_9PEZI|nr:hypothetical protein BU16DRAFT_480549 [Lophium mytilinum]
MSYLVYEFLARTPELIVQRRIRLDQYANIAQISQLIVHLIILFCNFAASIPVSKLAGKSQKGSVAVLARIARSLYFKLGVNVGRGYGTYGQWIFGLAWTSWLGFLCIAETAPDYLHLTKRFGLIAASQLPMHYLLAMPHPYSPLQLLSKRSYALNMSVHKVTGKIIIAFFAIHISLYSIFFVQIDMFWTSIRHSNIVVALISAAILFTLGVTSTGLFRRRDYWWFYKIHLIGSVLILPLLFFHVNHIRIYLFESAIVLVMNAVLRMFSSQKL